MEKVQTNSTHPPGRWRNPIVWAAVLLAVVVAAMVYSLVTGSQMAERYAPLADAAMEIKLEAAIGHLWFEEIISGDRDEEIASVLEHFDRSAWYARAMLDGGQNPEGVFAALRDPALRREVEEVLEKIREFRTIAEQRWAAMDQSGIASAIDQRFDAVFNDFLTRADEVETTLQRKMNRDLSRFQTMQGVLIAFSVGLFALVAIVFRRYQRQQALHMAALQKSEENLSITLDSIGDAVITTNATGAAHSTAWCSSFATSPNPTPETCSFTKARDC